jgi:hypothetical protein
VLKLHRGFLRDIDTDASDAAIRTATLAHSLGLKVVEYRGQMRFLEENLVMTCKATCTARRARRRICRRTGCVPIGAAGCPAVARSAMITGVEGSA